jgi:hypothetical protein
MKAIAASLLACVACTQVVDVPVLTMPVQDDRPGRPDNNDNNDNNDSDEGEGEAQEGEGDGNEGEGEGIVDDGNQGPAPTSCAAGLYVSGGVCIADGLTPLTIRSQSAVCARFQSDYQWSDVEYESVDDSNNCDIGLVPQAALDNAMTRTNLYRWLSGVDETSLIPELYTQQQACAATMSAIGYLSHQLSPDMACYTDEASYGAGSSNISQGAGLVGSVDNYVSDWGNETTFGHRRWLIGPYMSGTQFGHKNGFSCMHTFSVGGGTDPGYVAYPPPGYTPTGMAQGAYTFESSTYAPTQSTEVYITINDGVEQLVTSWGLDGWYGHYGSAIAFDVTDGWTAGNRVRVRITNTTAGDVRYTVLPVGC